MPSSKPTRRTWALRPFNPVSVPVCFATLAGCLGDAPPVSTRDQAVNDVGPESVDATATADAGSDRTGAQGTDSSDVTTRPTIDGGIVDRGEAAPNQVTDGRSETASENDVADSEASEAESGAPVCAEGETGCSMLTPEKCTNGQWQPSGSACPYVCDAGSCAGSCVPGTKQCSGASPQICDSTGTWVTGIACADVCIDGDCAGSCVPNTTQCSNNVPQTCDGAGKWVDGQACPYVCSNGSCTGVCVPNKDTRPCGGSACATTLTCQADGTWPSCTLPSNCQCSPGQTTPCTTSTYSCPGTEACVSEMWGPCNATGPCNCSNGSTQSCNSSACNPSTVTCANNLFPACPAAINPYTHDTGVLSTTGFAQTYTSCTPNSTFSITTALDTCAAVVGSSNCMNNACNVASVTGVSGNYAFNWEYTTNGGGTPGTTVNYSIGNIAACFPLSNCSNISNWCGGTNFLQTGTWD